MSHHNCANLEHSSLNRRDVRRQIILYVIATYGITYFLMKYLFFGAPSTELVRKAREWWPFILMWLPTLTAFLSRILFWQGFRDVGWKLGERKFWAWAIGGTLLVASFAYLCAYSIGVVSLAPGIDQEPLWENAHGWFTVTWPDWTPDSAVVRLFLRLGVVGTLALVPHFAYALGEELGWRGYLQTRLVHSGWPFPLLLCGFIWSQWHFPFLLVIWNRNPLEHIVWALLFTVGITLAGVFVGWLRLASGSVWVATMMHAAHNAFFGFYFVSFRGDNKWLWASESGIFSVVAYGMVAFWLYRSGKINAVRVVVPHGTKQRGD
jgi:membrane protease YdiL (CAAX protease family)